MNFRKAISSFILNEVLQQEVQPKINQNFWDWFGSSKVVDSSGNPLICYHGSNNPNIQVFDLKKIGTSTGNYGHYGYGFYFSQYIQEAKTYGSNIYKCFLKIEKPFTGTDEELLLLKNKGVGNIDDQIVLSIDFDSFKNSFKNDKNIFKFLEIIEKDGLEKAWDSILNKRTEVDLDKLNDISNLIEYTTLNKNVSGVPNYVFDQLKTLGIEPKLNKGFEFHQALHWITDLGNRSKQVTEIIKELGFDGVMYDSEIIPFYPNQIKSINNDGSWDVKDDNIFS